MEMTEYYPQIVDLSIDIEDLMHTVPVEEKEVQRFLRRARSNINNVLLELEAAARYSDTQS